VRVAWLTGACVAAPREALLELGPFDEAIHLYAEDMDLGLRAARAGIPSWLLPDTGAVVHHGGASARVRFGGREYGMAARNRRTVVRRVHGARAERWSWRAERLRWGLRVLVKRALRRPADHDRRELEAARTAPAP
jgi:GT2 family glycosyltransferase